MLSSLTLRALPLAFVAVLTLIGCASEPIAPEPEPEVLMFIARDPETRLSTLYRVAVDGSDLRAIGPVSTPTSPRIAVTLGDRYVYLSGKNGSELPLLRYDVSANTITPMGTLTAAFPTPSPDGTRLAYFEIAGSTYQLITVQADGSGRRVLVDASTVGLRLRVTAPPAWSPNADRLVVCGIDSSSPGQERTIPFIVNVNDGSITAMRTPTAVSSANWLTTSTLVYAAPAGSAFELRTFDVGSGTEADLGVSVQAMSSPFLSVSPDRTTIVCANPLTIVDVAAKRATTIGSVDAVIHDGMWSRNGTSFVYGDKTSAQLFSERLVHRTRTGEQVTLPGIDTLGSSASVSFVR